MKKKPNKQDIAEFQGAGDILFKLHNYEAPKQSHRRVHAYAFGDPGLYHDIAIDVATEKGDIIATVVVGIEEDTGEVRILSSSRDVVSNEMQESAIAIYPERTTDLAIKRLD
jgi:hypothetical protein